MMNKWKNLKKCGFLFGLLLFAHLLSYGQCTNCGSQYPSSTQTETSSNWSTISSIIYGSE